MQFLWRHKYEGITEFLVQLNGTRFLDLILDPFHRIYFVLNQRGHSDSTKAFSEDFHVVKLVILTLKDQASSN